jgi:hypothetical protein
MRIVLTQARLPGTYWAGGALDLSPYPQQAQVSAQDDGGYRISQEPGGGFWTPSPDSLAGTEGVTCPVHVPPVNPDNQLVLPQFHRQNRPLPAESPG